MVKEESSEEQSWDNVRKRMDSNDAPAASGEPTCGGMSPHGQARSQQLFGSGVNIKIEIKPELTPTTAVPQGSLIGILGSNQGGNPPHPQRQPLNQVARTNQQCQSQSSVNNIHQQDSITEESSMSNSFRGTVKNQNERKRKQQANSSGTAGDAISMANLPRIKGFDEVSSVRASTSKVTSCDFSSDGKLLATAGRDRKAVLWYTDTMERKTTLEEHTALITDVRFSPRLPRLATSSFDKTVRVWDVDNKSSSLRTFVGHYSVVKSLDFHPNKDDLLCSCDNDGEIRYWSINNNRSCTRVYKGGSTQIRFQPRVGKYLAALSANVVFIIDVETQECLHSLQGHSTPINSVCWDPSGDFLVSVSNDKVIVWTLSEGECIYELSCYGNDFQSCVFHPYYPTVLVIGCYQSIELWNMVENKVMKIPAHDCLIASLAMSTANGLVATASHDKLVKLWK